MSYKIEKDKASPFSIEVVGGRFDGTVLPFPPHEREPEGKTLRVAEKTYPSGKDALVYALVGEEAAPLSSFPHPTADYIVGEDGKARLMEEV